MRGWPCEDGRSALPAAAPLEQVVKIPVLYSRDELVPLVEAIRKNRAIRDFRISDNDTLALAGDPHASAAITGACNTPVRLL